MAPRGSTAAEVVGSQSALVVRLGRQARMCWTSCPSKMQAEGALAPCPSWSLDLYLGIAWCNAQFYKTCRKANPLAIVHQHWVCLGGASVEQVDDGGRTSRVRRLIRRRFALRSTLGFGHSSGADAGREADLPFGNSLGIRCSVLGCGRNLAPTATMFAIKPD